LIFRVNIYLYPSYIHIKLLGMLKMKYIFLLLILMLFKPEVESQNISFSEAELDRMINTYTFYVVQNITLETFAVKFPDLAKTCQTAVIDWDRVFLVSVKNIDKLLTDTLKEQWINQKTEIIHKFSGTDYTATTKTEAKKYIALVFQRSMGRMESPYLETLLMFKPGFLDFPEQELSEGYTGTYSTKNLKKPLGIDFKVLYPRTWLVIPGDPKTGLLQKYVSSYGLGKVSFFVNLENIKKEVSADALKQLISEENLKKNLSNTDSFISYTNEPAIDRLPTGVINYIRTNKLHDKTIYTQFETYHAYYKNFHISITFTYTTHDNPYELRLLHNRYNKLVRRLVLNIVVLSQWEKKRF